MKKEKRNPGSHELIREIIELYHPQSVKDIQDILKAELDTELGYVKNSQDTKTTENRRNGSYPKTVTSSMGEYEPELIPMGTKDFSALE